MTEHAQRAFRWSDVWLLQAVSRAAGGSQRASLPDVIAAADAMEHAIPAKPELDGAFGRLGTARLIEFDGQAVSLTPAGASLLAEIRTKARSQRASRAALERRLEATPWVPGDDPRMARGPEEPELISERDYARAVAEYKRRWRS